jgi:hypothetical protein
VLLGLTAADQLEDDRILAVARTYRASIGALHSLTPAATR